MNAVNPGRCRSTDFLSCGDDENSCGGEVRILSPTSYMYTSSSFHLQVMLALVLPVAYCFSSPKHFPWTISF